MEHGDIQRRKDLTPTPRQQRRMDELADNVKRSWEQVKMIEEEKLPRRTIQDMLNELWHNTHALIWKGIQDSRQET